jgi:hypothetical protein
MIALQRHGCTNKTMRDRVAVLSLHDQDTPWVPSLDVREQEIGTTSWFATQLHVSTSRGIHSATRTVTIITRAGQIEYSTLCHLPHSLGQSRAKSRSLPKWVWLGICLSTTSSKLCKKGKLCLFAVQSRIIASPDRKAISPASTTPTTLPSPSINPPCGNCIFPSFCPQVFRHVSVNFELCLRRRWPEPRVERKWTKRCHPRSWKR